MENTFLEAVNAGLDGFIEGTRLYNDAINPNDRAQREALEKQTDATFLAAGFNPAKNKEGGYDRLPQQEDFQTKLQREILENVNKTIAKSQDDIEVGRQTYNVWNEAATGGLKNNISSLQKLTANPKFKEFMSKASGQEIQTVTLFDRNNPMHMNAIKAMGITDRELADPKIMDLVTDNIGMVLKSDGSVYASSVLEGIQVLSNLSQYGTAKDIQKGKDAFTNRFKNLQGSINAYRFRNNLDSANIFDNMGDSEIAHTFKFLDESKKLEAAAYKIKLQMAGLGTTGEDPAVQAARIKAASEAYKVEVEALIKGEENRLTERGQNVDIDNNRRDNDTDIDVALIGASSKGSDGPKPTENFNKATEFDIAMGNIANSVGDTHDKLIVDAYYKNNPDAKRAKEVTAAFGNFEAIKAIPPNQVINSVKESAGADEWINSFTNLIDSSDETGGRTKAQLQQFFKQTSKAITEGSLNRAELTELDLGNDSEAWASIIAQITSAKSSLAASLQNLDPRYVKDRGYNNLVTTLQTYENSYNKVYEEHFSDEERIQGIVAAKSNSSDKIIYNGKEYFRSNANGKFIWYLKNDTGRFPVTDSSLVYALNKQLNPGSGLGAITAPNKSTDGGAGDL